ncbi:MAG: HPr family phosphocarrier protein [Pirellulaceae bacterium]|nr:HPr family phosphocarrier protein [Pirellulaceae bacterium]
MTNELVTRTVVVAHPHGLHMRPCSAIVNTVGKYQSHVEISNQRHTANARSLLDLLLLAAAGRRRPGRRSGHCGRCGSVGRGRCVVIDIPSAQAPSP